jgi:RNA polymerase sigma-70 factor (ECF subfamily)
MAAARSGDEWGFTELYREFAPPVLRLAAAKGFHDPEDVVSETMVSVARGLHRFDGGEGELRSWIFTIAYRRMADELRRRSRRVRTETIEDRPVPDGDPGPEGAVLDRLGGGPAMAALQSLTQDQQDVLVLRIVVGLPVAEVAAIVGKREAAVKMIQSRGLERLRRILAADVTFGASGAMGYSDG